MHPLQAKKDLSQRSGIKSHLISCLYRQDATAVIVLSLLYHLSAKSVMLMLSSH